MALHVAAADAIQLPVGGTADRPQSPQAGMLRFNTDTGAFEGFDGTSWITLGPAA